MAIGTVILDTEKVDFEGETPSSVSDLWALTESFLGPSNQVIDASIFDGEAWSTELGEPLESCREVRIASVPEVEKLSQLVDQLFAEEDKLIELWRKGASEALPLPWWDFQQRA